MAPLLRYLPFINILPRVQIWGPFSCRTLGFAKNGHQGPKVQANHINPPTAPTFLCQHQGPSSAPLNAKKKEKNPMDNHLIIRPPIPTHLLLKRTSLPFGQLYICPISSSFFFFFLLLPTFFNNQEIINKLSLIFPTFLLSMNNHMIILCSKNTL